MMNFEINDEQEKKLRNWQKTHPCKFRASGSDFRYVGSFGGADTFRFTPTSIGDVVIVVRCACGEEIDLSEYTF